jgi:uncharacterized repeat protein (TIGR03803 family)
LNTGSLGWGVSYSALLWALAVSAPQPAPAAPRETVLYSFTGGPDGAYPLSELLITKNGALIGTTSQGGALSACGGKGCGVVFKVTPPTAGSNQWKETVLYQFQGGNDGAAPLAGVLMDKTGALYGATSEGGGGPCHSYKVYATGSSLGGRAYWKKEARIGCGTIFKLTPPAIGQPLWTETVLYRFHGKDGRFAASPLIEKTGALYGVTGEGGEGPCGYIEFFNDHYSSSSLVQYPTGCGTVFKLTPPALDGDAWTLTTLHKFESKPDGAFPDGSVIFAADGSLLGTTQGPRPGPVSTPRHLSYHYRGGTVFQLTPPASGGTVWTQAILYAFSPLPGDDGLYPLGALYRDSAGALFGTTASSGYYGFGTVFQLSAPSTGSGGWGETTLHSFGSPDDGAYPTGGLIRNAATAAFYGVTGGGGGTGYGTAYSLTPPAVGKTVWTEAVLHRFGRGRDGRNPQARLAIDKAGNLYGTTQSGGAHLFGTVFKVSP